MKRYLSLALVFVFVFSLIPYTVSADNTSAELKTATVTGADIYPVLSSGVYNYEVIVTDENAILPEITYELNEGDAAQITQKAEYLGETTIIKVTGADGSENTYNFTYRSQYLSDNVSSSLLVSDNTTVSQTYPDETYSEGDKSNYDKGHIYSAGQ